MKCTIHQNREAEGMCVTCGKPVCKECLVSLEGKLYCKKHVADIFKANTSAYSELSNANGSYVQNTIYNHNDMYFSPRSRLLAFLLCFFFGIFGFHRFYVGKIGTGIIYLFTGGLFGLGYIIDLIAIVIGKFKDSRGRYLR